MANRKIFGLNVFAFVLVLFLRIEFNSSEELIRNEKSVILGKDITDPTRRSFSLIDRIRKSDPGNEWQTAEHPQDVSRIRSSAMNPYIGDEKKRVKRFFFLLPLLRGLTTAERAAVATGIGTTAVVVANQQKHNRTSGIYMQARKPNREPITTENKPRPGQSTRGHTSTKSVPKSEDLTALRGLKEAKPETPVQGGGGTSVIYMQARKPKSTTENKPRRGQSTTENKPRRGQSTNDHVGTIPVPKSEDITAFPGLEEAKRKTPVQGGGGLRFRWKDKKGKIYEWDYKKGELEVFDKTGQDHKGGYDPYDYPPRRITKPDPKRRVEP